MVADWHQQLRQAVDRHQRGMLGEAVALYRAVLSASPDNTDALHLLAMALEQAGQAAQGLPLAERAVGLDPDAAAYRNTLGNIHKTLGNRDAARAAYAAAVRLDPSLSEAHNNLGLLAQETMAWDAARAHFAAALQAEPGYAAARFNMAVTDWLDGRPEAALPEFRTVLHGAPAFARQITALVKRSLGLRDAAAARQLLDLMAPDALPAAERYFLQAAIAVNQNDDSAAEEDCRRALLLAPGQPDCVELLGGLLCRRGAYAEAVTLLEPAATTRPDDPRILSLLGRALVETGAYGKAVPLLRRLLQQQPDEPSVWLDLGHALFRQQDYAGARDAYRQAIRLDPKRAGLYADLAPAEAWCGDLDAAMAACQEALRLDPGLGVARAHLANILGLQRRFDEAEELYRSLLAADPDDATVHNNLGIQLLRQGRYAEGWQHYDWRWKSAGWTTPTTGSRGLPRWDGSHPPPGRLLVWREQGVGDEILYSSLLPDLAATGADVVLATDPRLVPLFGRSFPGITVVADDATLDPASLRLACQRPLGDLGGLLRPDAASFARHPQHGHLQVDTDLRDRLRQRYLGDAAPGDLLAGIAWSSRNRAYGAKKSLDLADMAGLFGRPGLRAVSLQYGRPGDDIAALERSTGRTVLYDAAIDPIASIDDQAAQIAALDLVITISTAAAHLAGALGRPTLLLLPDEQGVLWYWGWQGQATPWYGSVHICRSGRGETTADLIARAGPMLEAILAGLRP
ncbi:tetratricopeptide repeat protein [Ferrovibrio sp.]|uniref:tetratricopeptide repeat protein n=1 Tax=Ferrovibrio sp. TaxID=1917215 RepID=UPI0035182427